MQPPLSERAHLSTEMCDSSRVKAIRSQPLTTVSGRVDEAVGEFRLVAPWVAHGSAMHVRVLRTVLYFELRCVLPISASRILYQYGAVALFNTCLALDIKGYYCYTLLFIPQ